MQWYMCSELNPIRDHRVLQPFAQAGPHSLLGFDKFESEDVDAFVEYSLLNDASSSFSSAERYENMALKLRLGLVGQLRAKWPFCPQWKHAPETCRSRCSWLRGCQVRVKGLAAVGGEEDVVTAGAGGGRWKEG